VVGFGGGGGRMEKWFTKKIKFEMIENSKGKGMWGGVASGGGRGGHAVIA